MSEIVTIVLCCKFKPTDTVIEERTPQSYCDTPDDRKVGKQRVYIARGINANVNWPSSSPRRARSRDKLLCY